jgi:hypothetical protein
MSHCTRLKTRITDTAALVQALADLGYKNAEVHETAQRLYGFLGIAEGQSAEVIVRRKHVGWLASDIGFKRRKDGSFDLLVLDFNGRRCSPEWLGRLTQRYAYHVARAKLVEQGFDLVSEETAKDGRIHLVLRRMA